MFSSPASSASSSSSSIHPASLVDASMHSQALLDLIELKLTAPIIDYLVDCVAETVDFAMGRPTSSSSRGRHLHKRRPELVKFATFVTNVLTRAEVSISVVLAALVYIDRAKPHLSIALEEWALERVFLGAIISASKYLNDSTLKNCHWALCTGVFGKRDIGRIEREFLDVLDFELGMSEADLLSHHSGIIALVPRDISFSRLPHQDVVSPRPNKHPRHHHRSNVPELDPSSPESSEGSSSPQTPSTNHSSPVRPHHHRTTKSVTSLLKSFPMPKSHHSLLGSSQQYPIQVDV
ncbi:hypothetical protein C8J56DRAFT_867074 [Mycena floridula]|nr:hypothetical protein C8J56DRAFT_867074 [Mycena floridula]